MSFLNATGTIGVIVAAGTSSLTGNMVATLYMILIIIIAIAMLFRIPLEFMAVIIFPFCLAVGAYYSNFLVPIIIIIFFVGAIIAKNWIFK